MIPNSTIEGTNRRSARHSAAAATTALQALDSPTGDPNYAFSDSEDEGEVFKQRNSAVFHIPDKYKQEMDKGLEAVFRDLALTPAAQNRAPLGTRPLEDESKGAYEKHRRGKFTW